MDARHADPATSAMARVARAYRGAEPNAGLLESENRSILPGVTTLPLTEAKAKLNELVDDAVTTQERVTITRHGRPAAVLISVDDLESMEETLFWQSQAAVHGDISAGRAEAKAGQLHDEMTVRRRYGVGTAR